MNAYTSGEYRDRSTALVAVGILEILAGAVFALFALLSEVAGAVMAAQMPSAQAASPRALGLAVAAYLLLAVGFIWLGIGSIRARRWARALWVSAAAIGLIMGVIAVPSAWYATGAGVAAAAQAGDVAAAAGLIRVITVGFLLVGFLVIPGGMLWFYSSSDVRRTCEARDPKERWTDRCPLPVLGLALYAAYLGLAQCGTAAFRGIFPLFGQFVTGAPGVSANIVLALLWLLLARGLYRSNPTVWWLTLGLALLEAISNGLTMWHADLPALMAQMGLNNPAVASQFGRMPLLRWSGPANMAPVVIWLFMVRRHFVAAPPAPMAAQPGAV